MSRKRRVEFVFRLRRQREFQNAKPWHLEWLRRMTPDEQREIADLLEEYNDLEGELLWFRRSQSFMHCPDQLVRWRAIWWHDRFGEPRLCFARELNEKYKAPPPDLDYDDVRNYEPFASVNDNRGNVKLPAIFAAMEQLRNMKDVDALFELLKSGASVKSAMKLIIRSRLSLVCSISG
ncbi:hypothetical protein [Agrobacterium pusense]|uniref:Uncharacterized protein n=1 Tax=Agrobacterium pusense TaxID=648995 RepID=A0AA44EJS0_9HYPH|nr:hypothetical protein [Agrobacterium pusense]NRF09397.1 hypothetical protein [Agrobacterium pusense]NRF19698.1 hypothetical protein [Agrobacterium pusense]